MSSKQRKSAADSDAPRCTMREMADKEANAADVSIHLNKARRLLLAILLLGLAGTCAELLLLNHMEDLRQWIPLTLIGASFIVLAWHGARRNRQYAGDRGLWWAFSPMVLPDRFSLPGKRGVKWINPRSRLGLFLPRFRLRHRLACAEIDDPARVTGWLTYRHPAL